ncbi:MAG: polysaccharide deacetylase family protein [Chloroflexi bacterium]|nr:polysaccharide deacetylase family protein [Chloroflexota bacterium]
MILNRVMGMDNVQLPEKARWLPILMYHRVVDSLDAPDPYRLNVSVAQFESQMRYLRDRGYEAVRLDEVVRASGKGGSPWRKPVVITFDDGYMDTYTRAFPILKEYGMTATVLLVSGHIGGTNAWDRGEVPATQLAGPSEIREMARHGIAFGSHSVTHRPMTALNCREAMAELADSKVAIEDMLGSEVSVFAYPYGRSTPVLRGMAQQAGYIAACGIEERENTLFNLSRVDAAACADSRLLWRMKISGTHYRLRQSKSLRWLKSLLTRRS